MIDDSERLTGSCKDGLDVELNEGVNAIKLCAEFAHSLFAVAELSILVSTSHGVDVLVVSESQNEISTALKVHDLAVTCRVVLTSHGKLVAHRVEIDSCFLALCFLQHLFVGPLFTVNLVQVTFLGHDVDQLTDGVEVGWLIISE